MYAIVEISGRQFKVEKKQKLFVNRLDAQEGKKVSFDKVIVFKKKRRKGYKVRNGHRQAITEIEISDILTGVSKKAAPAKKEAKKAAPAKKEAKKAAPKKEKQDLTKLSVAALKDMAKSKGITGLSSMKKADLIKALS